MTLTSRVAFAALAAGIAILALAPRWRTREGRSGADVSGRGAPDGSVAGGGAAAGGDELRAREGRSDVEIVEERLRLDARLEVEVVEKATKRPIAGATVRASIDIRTKIQAHHSFEFSRTAKTGEDGVAVFDEFPRSTTVTARVGAEGHRGDFADVMLRADEGSKRMRFELVAALSPAQSSVRLTWPAGAAIAGAAVFFSDRTNGRLGHASPEAPLMLDDDPDAAPEHDVELQVIFPGYAGERIVRRLRRGTSFELTPPTSDRVAQEIAVVDEEGRGVEALAVTVRPVASVSASAALAELPGTTDDRGLVTLTGHRGTTWALRTDDARVQLPDLPDHHPFEVGGARPTFRVGRRLRHRLVLDGEGLAASGRCELVWRSYEPTPGSALERLLRDDPARYRERVRRYVERLPRAVEWSQPAPGRRVAELALLPGQYALLASTDRLYGRDATFEVARADAETIVPLARATPIRVRIEGSFDRSNGPLPYRTMVIAHRAEWDERAEIARVLGEPWAAAAKSPPGPGASDFDAAHGARMDETSLRMARQEAPQIGRDLGYVGSDGVCTLEAQGAPAGVTVLFPDLAVAYVPVEGDGATFRGRVDPSSFRRVVVRVRRTDGRAFPDYAVRPAPLERLRAGVTEFGARRRTDGEGAVRIGILPGESIGLHPGFDAWRVSAGPGALVERIETGFYPSFVVVTRADVVEPTIDIVAEPHQPR